MTIRDLIQELKRYDFDLETNVVGFKKSNILEVKVGTCTSNITKNLASEKMKKIKDTGLLEPANDDETINE